MKKEEFQRMLETLQKKYPSFFDSHMFLVNDVGDVEFFELKMTFYSVSAIEKFFDAWEKSLKYEEFQREERERIYGSSCHE